MTLNKTTVSNLDWDENGGGEISNILRIRNEFLCGLQAARERRYVGLHSEQLLHDVLSKSVETRMENKNLLEDDEDKLLLFALVQEMKTNPEHLKIDAKCDILSVLKKY